jgi:hypothetical protein
MTVEEWIRDSGDWRPRGVGGGATTAPAPACVRMVAAVLCWRRRSESVSEWGCEAYLHGLGQPKNILARRPQLLAKKQLRATYVGAKKCPATVS